MDFIQTFTVTAEEGSRKKISGEIPYDILEKERARAIQHLGKNIAIDGFRKGNIPEKMLIERIGEMNILAEMAERALAKVYPEAIKQHKIDAIGHPKIEITKIAQQNPLGFTATVAVLPPITLPDYKQIAQELNNTKESTDVTDEEVTKQIEDILRQKIAYERLQEKAKQKAEAEENGATLPTPETVDTVENEPDDIQIPELTDAYVQTLGTPGQFSNVADFKTKIKEHLSIEKEREVLAAHRAKITDAVIEKSEMDLPDILIESEIHQMFAQMEDDLKRAQLSMEEYLAHIKKTKDDLTNEWKPAAEKRAKLQLVLNEIANKEHITPDQSLVDQQVDQLLEQYKDADPERVRVYVSSILMNEAVMKMLEEQ